jgi:hypothetical protein
LQSGRELAKRVRVVIVVIVVVVAEQLVWRVSQREPRE